MLDTDILEDLWTENDEAISCERYWVGEGDCDKTADLFIRWSPCACGQENQYYCLDCYNVHVRQSEEGCDGFCEECQTDVVMLSVTTIR